MSPDVTAVLSGPVLHARAAAVWLVAVAAVQVALVAGVYARAETADFYYAASHVVDVREGGPQRWAAGFPLTAAEVVCDRTAWRVYFYPGVESKEDPHLECVPSGGL